MYQLQVLNQVEASQLQIALSSRIELLASIIGTSKGMPACFFSERIEAQISVCENVLARIRGEA